MVRWDGPPALAKAQLQPEAGADLQSLLNSRHSGDEYRYLGLGLYVCPFGKGAK